MSEFIAAAAPTVTITVGGDDVIVINNEALPKDQADDDGLWEILAESMGTAKDALQKLAREEWIRHELRRPILNDRTAKKIYERHTTRAEELLLVGFGDGWDHTQFKASYQHDEEIPHRFEQQTRCFVALRNLDLVLAFIAEQPSLSEAQARQFLLQTVFQSELTASTLRAALEALLNPNPDPVPAITPAASPVAFQPLVAGRLSPPDALTKHIELCRSISSPRYRLHTSVYSRYCAVVQGSGVGKSRLTCELHRHYFVVYLCLCPSDSPGYPLRSPIADFFLQLHSLGEQASEAASAHKPQRDVARADKESPEAVRQTNNFARFFVALFTEVCERAERWMEGLPINQIEERRKRFLDKMNEESASFWTGVKNRFSDQTDTNVEKAMDSALRKLEGYSSHETSTFTPTSSFIVVLDEASAMLDKPVLPSNELDKRSHFAAWRRSVHAIGAESWFFLLLDTHSAVASFLPISKKDSAARVIDCEHLCPPFFCFPFTGPWSQQEFEGQEQLTVFSQSVMQCSKQCAKDVLRFSRPLFLAAALNSPFDKVLKLAEKKLFGKSPGNIASLLCFRYSVRPSQWELKNELLRSHAATLITFNPSCGDSDFIVGYVPEPMLGEAAYRQMKRHNIDFCKIVDELHQKLQNGHIAKAFSKGDRGEFAVCVFLLEMMDRAFQSFERDQRVGSNDPLLSVLRSTPVPLRYWLSSLAGCADVAEIDGLFNLMNGIVDETTQITYVRRGGSQADCDRDKSLQKAENLRDRIRTMRKSTLQCCKEACLNFTGWFEARSSSVCAEDLQRALDYCLAWIPPPGEPATDLVMSLRLSSGLGAAPIGVQVQHHTDDVYISWAINILRAQGVHLRLHAPNAPVVISLLFMVGLGKLTIDGVPRSSPVLVLVPHSHEDELDAKTIYIVVNGFGALSEEEEMRLRNLLRIADIGEKACESTASIKSIASNAKEKGIPDPESACAELDEFYQGTLDQQLGTKARAYDKSRQGSSSSSSSSSPRRREWSSLCEETPSGFVQVLFLSDPCVVEGEESEEVEDKAVFSVRAKRKVEDEKQASEKKSKARKATIANY